MVEPIQPLQEQRYRDINTALALAVQAKSLMDKVERCDVDVSGDRAYFNAQIAKLEQWKAQFFPHKP